MNFQSTPMYKRDKGSTEAESVDYGVCLFAIYLTAQLQWRNTACGFSLSFCNMAISNANVVPPHASLIGQFVVHILNGGKLAFMM